MERRLPFILIAAGIAHFSGELSLVRCPEGLRGGSRQQLPRQDRHALPRQGVELGDGAPQLRAHPLLPPGCDRVRGLGHSPRAPRLGRERVARRARQSGAVSGVLSGAFQQFERLGQSDRGQLPHRRQSGRDLERGLEQSCAVGYFRHGPLHRLQGRRSDEPVLARLLARPHRLRACDPDLLLR